MVLRIHGHNLDVTDSLDTHVTDRFKAALDQLLHMVHEVIIRLEDINGPKGGVDKRCHATVYLRNGSTVVLEEVNPDIYAAVSLAADRAKSVVGRKVQKIREK